MSPLYYSTVTDDDVTYVTFIGPNGPQVTDSNHPNFDAIMHELEVSRDGLPVDPQEVADLFNVEHAIDKRFRRLSERVSAKNGQIYLDNDPLNNAVADQALRFLTEGVENWEPLIKFFENVAANPDRHSRDNMADWLASEEFTITEDGLIVGYRYVTDDGDGDYYAGHQGYAIVDGVEIQGRIPNPVGAIVEMPRSLVNHDPSQGCSSGLHVGNWRYSGNGYRTTLMVLVNPRDVVSVPTDAGGSKMRVCRFEVVGPVTEKFAEPVVTLEAPESASEADGNSALGDSLPEAQEAVSEPQDAPLVPVKPSPQKRVRYNRPKQAEFDELASRAKTRKQNLVKYITKVAGWTLTGDDPKDRLHWHKPPKGK
jgi:hypothetical protein